MNPRPISVAIKEKAMNVRELKAPLIIVAALYLVACGSSGGDAPPTGNVAVVITDAPTHNYNRVEISLTEMILIGAGGQTELYNGPEITFDLLEMSEWGDLAFNSQVLAGTYNKIRLQITRINLYEEGKTDPDTIQNLPANGKIDLNPRGPFDVSPGVTTVIKLDIDAQRSFLPVQTGMGKMQFRPIIFVEIFHDETILPQRLVRAFGKVQEGSIDNVSSSFRLCNLQFISQTNGVSLGSPDECISVHADGSPGLFDETGKETEDFENSIEENQLLTAIGWLGDTNDPLAYLALQSIVLELGDRDSSTTSGWDTTHGSVRSDLSPCPSDSDQCFDFDPSGDDPALATVRTRMQPATQVYRADGAELTQADVSMDDSGSIDGKLGPNGQELFAALVVLSTNDGGLSASGTVGAKSSVMGSSPDEYIILNINTDAGSVVEVCVAADAAVAEVIVNDGIVTILDGLLDVSEIQVGDRIEAYADTAEVPDEACEFLVATLIIER